MILRISLRKLLHNYAIPIFASVIFVVVFVGLWVAHQYALASVSNLAETNPLIVSDKTTLVSNDQSADPVVEQLADNSGQPATNAPASSSGGSSTPAPQSQAGTGSASPRPSTSGGSSGGGTSPVKPPVQQTPFSVSLGSIEDKTTRTSVRRTLLGIIIGCTVDHQFKIPVTAQNGPGLLKYRWVRSNGGESSIEQKNLGAGNSSTELTYSMTTSSWGDYSVTLEVSSPTVMEKKYNFSHRC